MRKGLVGPIHSMSKLTRAGTDGPLAREFDAWFTANGGLYLVGGSDGTSPKGELYWAVPDSTGRR